MKYLELKTLDHINAVLSSMERNGDNCMQGRVEAYSCKNAGEDKKLYKSLENKFSEDLDDYQDGGLSIVSPFGPLTQNASRKTLYYLISTLNASFPDYDFSNAKAEQFTKQPLPVAHHAITTAMTQPGLLTPEFIDRMWAAIDEDITLSECDIYIFTPDADSDPYADEGALWSFSYFFYNKKKRRIIFLSCAYINLLSPKLNGVVGPSGDMDDLDVDDGMDDDEPFVMDTDVVRARRYVHEQAR